jgi:aryl-alcohol dehydrogenase-like predicted oxidoreductase
MEVSVLGFGAAEIGFEGASQDTVDRMLGLALDSGVNVIDTAECYGESESLIGRAVSHRRGDFLLFTKCGHASGLDIPDWSPELIARSIDRSLQRLRTDYVDIVHLHSCEAAFLPDGIAALRKARDEGKARWIGYSGDSADAEAAVRTGAFDSLQTSVSLADQEAITSTVPCAAKQGMGVIAKRAIANAAWKYPDLPESSYHREYWARLRHIDYLFLSASPLEEAVATALRFTLSVPGVSMAITGTKSEERWRQNVEAVNRNPSLPPDQYEAIRQIWRDRAKPEWTGQV